MEKKQFACAFTGHRDLAENFNKEQLKSEIIVLIEEGATAFYCGMAVGFDLLAAETVLALKKDYPFIKLVACIPCEGQDKYFSPTQKEKYASLVELSDEKIILYPRYVRGCMQARNRYMCDNAEVLIAHLYKDSGGTAGTVAYFEKKYPDKRIVRV